MSAPEAHSQTPKDQLQPLQTLKIAPPPDQHKGSHPSTNAQGDLLGAPGVPPSSKQFPPPTRPREKSTPLLLDFIECIAFRLKKNLGLIELAHTLPGSAYS
eukprot:gene27009-9027_t